MFKRIGNLFKSKNNKKDVSVAGRQPVTRENSIRDNSIRYDADLIDSLENDHVKLVKIYERIWSEGFKPANYVKTATLISQFKSLFQAHLLAENVKFYVYLEQSFEKDPHNLTIVKEFRSDMNDIANAAVKFCKRYQGNFSKEMINQFKTDYAAIGEVLTRRISLEEKSLYVLYRPR